MRSVSPRADIACAIPGIEQARGIRARSSAWVRHQPTAGSHPVHGMKSPAACEGPGTWGTPEVRIAAGAWRSLMECCRRSGRSNLEAAGLLIGALAGTSPVRVTIERTEVLPPLWTGPDGACFDHRSWLSVFRNILSGQALAGWYHTHPDGDLSLSRADREFHRMFRRRGQISLILQPGAPVAALYHWIDPGCSQLGTIVLKIGAEVVS